MASFGGVRVDKKGLGDLLRDHSVRVPIYQRAYAWKKEHVEELFRDFRAAFDKGTRDYFLGSIVATRKKSADPEVVDGQQRLCTVSILLAAIRDRYVGLQDPVGAEIVEKNFLFDTDLQTRLPKQRLVLSEEDHDFFLNHILESPSKRSTSKAIEPSHKKLVDAQKCAAVFVEDITSGKKSAEAKQTLSRWVAYIKEQAQVIWITVPEEQDAFVIFETLNDRGLELSISDLLKNFLFGRATKKRVGEVKHQWTKMLGILKTSGAKETSTNFIHQFWTSKHGLIRKRELFQQISDRIDTPQDAVDFANELVANATLYSALRNASDETWNTYGLHSGSIRSHLSVLNDHLKVWQIRSLLLAVIAHFSKSDVRAVMQLTISWSVRFLTAGGSPGNLESWYTTAAMRVRLGEIKNAKALAQYMLTYLPDDKTFEASFASVRVTTARLANYYLRCLERAADNRSEPQIGIEDDKRKASLEHIYPQSPTEEHWGHIPINDRKRLQYRLGNLALLKSGDNTKRGNGSFEAAKKIYTTSDFAFTKMLKSHRGKWNESGIATRQAKMAKKAVNIWPLTIQDE